MTSKLAKWTFIGWILWMLFCITNGGDLLWCNIVFFAPILAWLMFKVLWSLLRAACTAASDGWDNLWSPRVSTRRRAKRAFLEERVREALLEGLGPVEYQQGRKRSREKLIEDLNEILGLDE